METAVNNIEALRIKHEQVRAEFIRLQKETNKAYDEYLNALNSKSNETIKTIFDKLKSSDKIKNVNAQLDFLYQPQSGHNNFNAEFMIKTVPNEIYPYFSTFIFNSATRPNNEICFSIDRRTDYWNDFLLNNDGDFDIEALIDVIVLHMNKRLAHVLKRWEVVNIRAIKQH